MLYHHNTIFIWGGAKPYQYFTKKIILDAHAIAAAIQSNIITFLRAHKKNQKKKKQKKNNRRYYMI